MTAAAPLAASHDGSFYRALLRDEQKKLDELLQEYEPYLALDLAEPAADAVRLATGKARLVSKKKMTKMAELCEANLTQKEEDERKTLPGDLDGYWTLVKMELDDVHAHFELARRFRANGWQEPPEEAAEPNGDVNKNTTNGKAKGACPKTAKPVVCVNAEKDAERRQKLREAKLAVMQRKEQQQMIETAVINGH